MYLSKSDYIIASSCAKKLVYKKRGYPTANDTDEYMEMLAEGGYIVGEMATLLFPDGIKISGTLEEALLKTSDYLKQGNCILFEGAIQSGSKLIRIDILKKSGNTLHLIEVKAKSHDTNEEEYLNKKKLKEYIEDVAYQYLVLSEAYGNFEIKASLLMPDKAKRTSIEGLAGWFNIINDTQYNSIDFEELPAQLKPIFSKPVISFKFKDHAERDKYISELLSNGILEYLDVTNEVINQQDIVKQKAETFIRILEKGITNSDYKISKICKACEFNTGDIEPNGYKECLGDMASTEHHIFDLYYGGAIGHPKTGWYIDELLRQKKSSLFEIDLERLKNKKGELGARG